MVMKIKVEITKGFDGETIKDCGIVSSEEEAYQKLREEVVDVYIKEIYYIRVTTREPNLTILDFGSYDYFGRFISEE